MGKKQRFKVNLLGEEKFERTKLGQVVTWAITVGRYLVIFTELIVIGAFLSRFYFDRVLTDLNDEIKQKKAVIQSFSEVEAQVKSAHARIETVQKYLDQQLLISQRIAYLSQALPPDVSFKQLSFDQNEAQITGIALSKQGAANFLTTLKASPHFTSLNLGSLTSSPDQAQVEFALNVGFKE